MRKAAFILIVFIAARAEATVRCAGTNMQRITVDSGQSFTLPVNPIAGVLDYEVARAVDWTLNDTETWSLGGTIRTSRVRETSGAPPDIRETLYNTGDFSYGVLYVVTATNAFDNQFKPCAQDYLVEVKPDPVLARDAQRAVVAVAGSLRGANNSVYKTRVSMHNPWDVSINGQVVFHPSGSSGSANDPKLSYSIASGATRSWDDIVAAAGGTGLGSLDIVPELVQSGSRPMPQVRVQVISVAANGGAFGTDVPAVAMTSEEFGAVWVNAGPEFIVDDQNGSKRLAIGIRTLADAVTVGANLIAPDGTVRATFSRDYPADFHEQRSLSDWFSVPPQRNDRVSFFAAHRSAPRLPGGAIVYLSETDNVTNDVTVVVPAGGAQVLDQPIVNCSIGCGLLVR
jgi:hypothetical protein